MPEWNVDHIREPENGRCPVCGEKFARATECYPEAETTIPSGRNTKACVIASVASASPDPTLIRIDHGI